MIKFYFNLAPNPTKVALMLEETGLPYELVRSTRARASSTRPRSAR
jgi:GST-like protein